jgi:nucleotide-binding universal stress UspA family protein
MDRDLRRGLTLAAAAAGDAGGRPAEPSGGILCAVDLGDGTDLVLRHAHELAEREGRPLDVLFVLAGDSVGGHSVVPLEQAPYSDLPALQRNALDALQARFDSAVGRAAGGARFSVETGAAYAVIVEQAESRRAALVVVGAHGSSGAGRPALGSVSERVVRYAPCPVRVVRETGPGRHVLAATDFSEPAGRAVRAAAEEARRIGGRLTVLHSLEVASVFAAPLPGTLVVPPMTSEHRARAIADAHSRLSEAVRGLDLEVEPLVTDGDAAQDVVGAAESLPARLVVLGTVGRTGFARLLLGSVAETVVRQAPCSVLVVR